MSIKTFIYTKKTNKNISIDTLNNIESVCKLHSDTFESIDYDNKIIKILFKTKPIEINKIIHEISNIVI